MMLFSEISSGRTIPRTRTYSSPLVRVSFFWPPISRLPLANTRNTVTETVPVRAAFELGADFVIAVDVGDSLRDFDEPRNALDIIARADYLARNALNQEQLKSADVILSPENGVTHWADFSTTEVAIRLGEEEVERQIDSVWQAIKKAQRKRWFS